MAQDTKTLFRIFIQPQGALDGQLPIADIMSEYGAYASGHYTLSSVNLSVTDISNEDNRNAFYYDLLLACLLINKKIRSEDDVVIFFIKGMPDTKRNGIATAWASYFALEHMIFFSKIFDTDAHISFMFDMPYKSKSQACIELEQNFKTLLTRDFYLDGIQLERLKKPILTKSGIKAAKLKKIERYLDKINSQELPAADVSFCFYSSETEEPIDYPLSAGLLDADDTSLAVRPRIYKLKA